MPLVLGVDSSTQSTKVEVRDADSGELVASGRAPHPPTQPPVSEQEPDAWWRALAAAIADAGAPAVDAVSVAGQQHGMVLLDRRGRALRPAKLWNDTESAPEAARMVEELGAEAWAEATGSVPVAAYTLPKLAWAAAHEPEVLEELATVVLPHDYLTHGLTGRYVTDRGDASGTGYFSPAEGRWRTDLLDRFVAPGPWEDRLPEVLGPTDVCGEIAEEAHRELGLPAGGIVGPGTGDNMAAALGVGLAPGEVCLSLGTSGTVYATAEEATAEPTGAVAGFADATGRYLPLVCTLNATKVTAAFARLLGVSEADLGELALLAKPGASGVVVVPYLDGERTPNRPDATGQVLGLRSDASREDLARAAFEGVVCGLLDGLDVLAAATEVEDGRLVLVGGGARSAAYRQVLADLSGRSVVVPDHPEQVATGACVQAAAVLHQAPLAVVQLAWSLRSGRVTEPDPSVDAAAVRGAYRDALGQ
jgi:xylulokinase